VPTFDGSGGSVPANVTFPVLSSSLKYDSTGASPVMSSQSAMAAITTNSTTVILSVPSLNLNESLPVPLSGTPMLPTPGGWDQSTIASRFNTDYVSAWGLSYVSLGLWLHSGAQGAVPQITFTTYAFGYETPAEAMPTSGSAIYLGPGAVRGIETSGLLINANNCVDCNFWVAGDASFAVNFATGKIDGSFANMKVYGDSGALPWYDVSVGASIAAGTNKFSGNTGINQKQSPTVGYVPGNGRIDGAFYGPNAQNLGAIWSLTTTNWTVLGGVAAGH
jgi:hypothetical protein